MKTIFSYFIKTLLLTILLGSVYSFFVGWINIWIKNGHVGILYFINSSTDSNKSNITKPSNHILIEKSNYNWQWKRITPFQTQLLQIPLSLQSITIPIQYYLPNAKLYSEKINKTEEIFLSSGIATIDYRIDVKKLLPFIIQNNLITNEDILHSIKQEITNNIAHAIIKGIESQNTNTLKNTLKTIVSQSPVTNTNIDILFHRRPDYDAYTFTKNIYLNESSIISPKNEKQNFNQEYLFFLQNISELIKQSPKTLELIQLVPPEKIYHLLINK